MYDGLALLHYTDQGCRLEDQQGWLRTPRALSWAARKASGVRTPSFCAQLCASVTLARHLDLSVLPASFPHPADGASLSHLSQYPRLRKEQAQGGVGVGGGRPQRCLWRGRHLLPPPWERTALRVPRSSWDGPPGLRPP